jgi:hypothetical protein
MTNIANTYDVRSPLIVICGIKFYMRLCGFYNFFKLSFDP